MHDFQHPSPDVDITALPVSISGFDDHTITGADINPVGLVDFRIMVAKTVKPRIGTLPRA